MKSILTTEMFDNWYAGLNDRQAVTRIQARIDRAEDGNFGDCAQRGMELVILLAGSDKSTQSKDINTALKLAREL